MQILSPDSWTDYELIDSGFGEKFERFGPYRIIRPEPQALWQPVLPESEWRSLCHARFDREQKDHYRFTDDVKGGWKGKMPESWNINYRYEQKFDLKIRLALTGFGHVGVFPEQGANWNFIFDALQSSSVQRPKVLNLFAYTGAASMVCRMAGAEVTHVDASRPGLNWASQNMALNGLDSIRWVYEDAMKFVRREVKRGNIYHAVIMDPPPYGRGPDGEKWTLAEKIDELVSESSKLLSKDPIFFLMSLYAAGYSAQVGMNVVQRHFKTGDQTFGEFLIRSEKSVPLPMGSFVRIKF